MVTGTIEAPKRLEDLHVRRDLVASLLLRTLAFADQLTGAALEQRLHALQGLGLAPAGGALGEVALRGPRRGDVEGSVQVSREPAADPEARQHGCWTAPPRPRILMPA